MEKIKNSLIIIFHKGHIDKAFSHGRLQIALDKRQDNFEFQIRLKFSLCFWNN